jgi:predicted lactoylglutathione lyase
MSDKKPTIVSQIYVNLPVADLPRSIEFFTRLGFRFNPQFTDETATCMILGENMHAMLLSREKFAGFSPVPVADAKASAQVLIALGVESREKVDEIVEAALASGGSRCRDAADHGWMYERSFRDIDGHVWELLYADVAALESAQQGAA